MEIETVRGHRLQDMQCPMPFPEGRCAPRLSANDEEPVEYMRR